MSAEPDADAGRRRTALVLGGVALGMVALSFASVPLYKLFCQATGFGGTPRIAAEGEALPQQVLDREVSIRLDSNVSGALPWSFRPDRRDITLKVGEATEAVYHIRNLSGRPTTGRAVYSVLPERAAPYFVKVNCFCFEAQTLQPGEGMDVTVAFYVDPAIAEDPMLDSIRNITLSYSFFLQEGEAGGS